MRCASGLALDTLSCPKRGSSVRRQGDRMTEPRHREPLPLGGDGIPYSKGLMARALTATGVKTVQAYELALRIEADLHARGERTVEFDRAQELAVEVLGREVGERAIDRV